MIGRGREGKKDFPFKKQKLYINPPGPRARCWHRLIIILIFLLSKVLLSYPYLFYLRVCV